MKFNLKVTSWAKDHAALSEIRRKVFIEEQNVPEELEWDEFDEECIHILVTNTNNKPIACGRMKDDGHIGRMAVLNAYRKIGIGTAILNKLSTSAANEKITTLFLHAQVTAIPFYDKLGFSVSSEEFMDAGIPHKSMKKQLTA